MPSPILKTPSYQQSLKEIIEWLNYRVSRGEMLVSWQDDNWMGWGKDIDINIFTQGNMVYAYAYPIINNKTLTNRENETLLLKKRINTKETENLGFLTFNISKP